MSNVLIGIAGDNGAGKDTIIAKLLEELHPLKFSSYRSSDVLLETFRVWRMAGPNNEVGRGDFDKMVATMQLGFGKNILAEAMRCRFIENPFNSLWNGVRLFDDVKVIKTFPWYMLVHITADPRIRFERMQKRGAKAGESEMSFAQFQEEEALGTNCFVPLIGQLPGVVRIKNNGTMDELKPEIERLAGSIRNLATAAE